MPDNQLLDYATASHQQSWSWRRIVKIIGVIFGIGVAILGGFWCVVWMEFHDMDRVNLTVDNQTAQLIDSAQITDGNDVPILTIGPINPGKQASSSVHFGNDEGGQSNLILRRGTRISSQTVWMLISTHGPYDYTATVRDTGVHLEYDVASKGSGSYDFASPTKMP